MNMQKVAEKIYVMPMSKSKKIKLLKELILDCHLELEAENENMPAGSLHHLAEGLRVANIYLRELEQESA